jgi:hypothetical protein
MKTKAILLSAIFSILLCAPCYAEPPGSMAVMGVIALTMILICGIALGLLVKAIFSYSRIESVKNWQIFLATIILSGIFLIKLLG